jgi:hypothetical protein
MRAIRTVSLGGEHATNSPEINGVRATPVNSVPVFLIKSLLEEFIVKELGSFKVNDKVYVFYSS